jgi:predicted TIM-barrel fold metal-dependent hydrolase
MRVIDGHVFLGKTIYMKQNPEGLIADMDRLGIDISVVVTPPPGPFYLKGNMFVMEAVRRFPNRLAPLFMANPHLEGEVDRLKSGLERQGFVGVQLNPTNDGYAVSSPIIEPFIEVALESEVPVYVHSGDSIFCPPEDVADLAAKFENVNFVTTMSLRAPRAAQNHSNLYLMTRPFPTLAFQRGYAKNFDVERLIFATDVPLGNPDIELKRVELAKLEQDVQEKILERNLQRIMDLDLS